jgi:hypothetical protein
MCLSDYRNLKNYTIDSLVASQIRDTTLVFDETLNGTDCVVSRYTRPGEAEISIWLARDMDFSAVAIEGRTEEGHTRISTNYGLDERSGFWFPTHYEYYSFHGDVLKRKEVADIRVVELNPQIDPEVFTLRGMAIPVGTGVNVRSAPDGGDTFYWDGEKLIGADR